MRFTREDLLLYAVTDRRWATEMTLLEQVEEALKGGATFVQLREKHLSTEAFIEEARACKKLCEGYGVPFVINDNVEVAKAVDADGVHVGQKDWKATKVRELLGPDKIIGVSAQTFEQAVEAQKMGADYLGVGAVFPTASKEDAQEVSKEVLRKICKGVEIPVVAIGGITKENTKELKGCAMDGIAVISAIFAEEHIAEATQKLKEEAYRAVHGRPTALTIAGTDSSGGAGIQADLKTMLANGVYGMSAITAMTAQNTLGVLGVQDVSPEFLKLQLESVFTDIAPDAVKIGMVSSKELIPVIDKALDKYQPAYVVLDPVMVSTSGSRLLEEEAVEILKQTLLRKATLITPNIPEAEVLTGQSIHSMEEMEAAARALQKTYGCNVLIKGGHGVEAANDFLAGEQGERWFYGERIENLNTHGTGCTLSSAICSNLAKGVSLAAAIENGKKYVTGALQAQMDLGKGSGPLDHGFLIK